MRRAAAAYASGATVTSAPPSLRLWALAKANPGALAGFDALAQHPALWLEWEEYARAEAREAKAQQAAQQRRSPRVAGRRR